jgi:hypothetical protein
MSEDDFDYFERETRRGEAAARIIIMAWLFLSGAGAGWVGRGIWGG